MAEIQAAMPFAHVWIDSAGESPENIATVIASVVADGVPADRIILVVDSDAHDHAAELAEVAAKAGIVPIDAAAHLLDEAVDSAQAEFLIVVRMGRVLPGAFAALERFARRFPEADVLYGDSDSRAGAPLLRPRFSPIRLRSNDYLGPVVAVRMSAIRAMGGFRAESRRSQVLDLALRAHDSGISAMLVPEVLASEDLALGEFASTAEAQTRVVTSYLGDKAIDAVVDEVEPFVRRIRYTVTGDPLVSIVIPTRGGSAQIAGKSRVLVSEAIRGILERSTYQNVEFVIVADAETPGSVVDELEAVAGGRLKLVAWNEEFNFSAKMNRGAVAASGDYLLLLNDDVELVSPDWIETMVGLAQQDGVGIVGAQLYFEDSTIQHAGQVYTGGVAGHAAFGWTGGRDDSIKSMLVDHEVSGVTAACALLSRDVYFEVGGFTLALPGNYNDVDLNMKIRATGRSAVFSPWVRLYHFESKSRDPRILPSDLETLQSRWARRMQVEMYSRMM